MIESAFSLRSLLFAPASDGERMRKALRAGADAAIFDLEDAVRSDDRPGARDAARGVLDSASEGDVIFVRVNGVDSGATRDDVLGVMHERLAGVVLPKVRHPQDLRDVDVMLREAETSRGIRPGTVGVLPIIESAVAVLRSEQIATAIDRVIGLAIGGEDYTAELGVERTAAGAELAHIRGTVVQVATAYGIEPIDAPWIGYRDGAGLEADARTARGIGLKGKLAIHPDQVETINRVFSPSEREVDRARRIVDAFEAAGGEGVVSVDGRMVDAPVAARARAVLAAARR